MLIIVLFSVFIIGILIARHNEKRQWNNGYCACGSPWRHFDNDSQGGRGYCCDKCHSYIWISYRVDKRANSPVGGDDI